MIGRFAYNHPWAFRHADSTFYGQGDPGLTRREIVEQYLDYGAVMLVGGWVGGWVCRIVGFGWLACVCMCV